MTISSKQTNTVPVPLKQACSQNVSVLWPFKHANSGSIMPEIVYSLFVRPTACTKELLV